MTYIFIPTLLVAALGLFAAKAGDLLRSPLFKPEPCPDNASAVVWPYEAQVRKKRASARRMGKGAWFPLSHSGRC